MRTLNFFSSLSLDQKFLLLSAWRELRRAASDSVESPWGAAIETDERVVISGHRRLVSLDNPTLVRVVSHEAMEAVWKQYDPSQGVFVHAAFVGKQGSIRLPGEVREPLWEGSGHNLGLPIYVATEDLQKVWCTTLGYEFPDLALCI